MANINFVQSNSLFKFTATRCLRNEYYHNDCRICLDLCPKGAFGIIRNKLTFFGEACINCAGCIGSCPTEALELESFDPNAYVATYKEQKDPLISCKINTPCLGTFDSEHYISMALRSEHDVVCDMRHCNECSLNETGALEQVIRKKIDQSNDFLSSIGFVHKIETQEEKDEQASRRVLFRKGFEKVKEHLTNANAPISLSMTQAHHNIADMRMPLKRVMLKHSLKEIVGDLKTTTFSESSPLFFNKQIDFQACTNCGECTQFCPTDALFPTSDKQGIYFSQGKCIGCSICNDICKPNAMSNKEGFDLISIAFDRAEELVHYELVMCPECRTPYPYKGGDPICDRCTHFVNAHANMFTLAKDI